MSEKPLPFVVNDRRKFTSEGELRPDIERAADPESAAKAPTTPIDAPEPPQTPEIHAQEPEFPSEVDTQDSALPPPPTREQMEQARLAFNATADRLDTAIRASNPGMDHPAAMTFEQLVQSIYMQSIIQLGGGAQEGQQPQVDILGARQSIDTLAILSEKTAGNLTEPEQRLLDSALFELQLAFLEITQALARSAQARASQSPLGGPTAVPGRGPSIVR